MNLGGVAHDAGYGLLFAAVCGAIYAFFATIALHRFLQRPSIAPVAWPAMTILKPLHGDEPGLYENLESFCTQRYDGPLRLVIGVQDPADPALAAAERLQRAHPDRDIIVVADPTVHGANRKIGNLINMSAHVRGEVVVISDSDVRLPADGLANLAATLERPGVGLVHCLYRGRPIDSAWARLAAMDVNTRFAPSVVVGEALGAHPVLGPTMALHTKLLAQIGGIGILADVLADDFELGRAVRAAGRTIAIAPMLIDHVFPETSAEAVFHHELRWARTIRLVQPSGYLGSVIIHFVPLALLGAILTGLGEPSLVILVGLALMRQSQAMMLCRMLRADDKLLWLLPVRDLLTLVVFLAAIFGDRVRWRGNRLRVGRDGAIAAT
jgi:ceramide glucosyltransferase